MKFHRAIMSFFFLSMLIFAADAPALFPDEKIQACYAAQDLYYQPATGFILNPQWYIPASWNIFPEAENKPISKLASHEFSQTSPLLTLTTIPSNARLTVSIIHDLVYLQEGGPANPSNLNSVHYLNTSHTLKCQYWSWSPQVYYVTLEAHYADHYQTLQQSWQRNTCTTNASTPEQCSAKLIGQ